MSQVAQFVPVGQGNFGNVPVQPPQSLGFDPASLLAVLLQQQNSSADRELRQQLADAEGRRFDVESQLATRQLDEASEGRRFERQLLGEQTLGNRVTDLISDTEGRINRRAAEFFEKAAQEGESQAKGDFAKFNTAIRPGSRGKELSKVFRSLNNIRDFNDPKNISRVVGIRDRLAAVAQNPDEPQGLRQQAQGLLRGVQERFGDVDVAFSQLPTRRAEAVERLTQTEAGRIRGLARDLSPDIFEQDNPSQILKKVNEFAPPSTLFSREDFGVAPSVQEDRPLVVPPIVQPGLAAQAFAPVSSLAESLSMAISGGLPPQAATVLPGGLPLPQQPAVIASNNADSALFP